MPRSKFLPHWIPGIIRHDFARKMIALFLAGIVCFVVRENLKEDFVIADVPVLVDVPADMIVMEEKLPRVSVKIKCSKFRYSRLSSRDFEVQLKSVDPVRYRKGQSYPLKLTVGDVIAPFGIEVADLEPKRLNIRFNRFETRSIPVKPVYFPPAPMKGFALVGDRTTPEKVQVTAPDSIIGSLELKTKPIPLDKIRESFTTDAEIDNIPQHVTVNPAHVEVNVEIGPERTNLEFTGIPIRLLTNDNHRKVRLLGPQEVTVIVSGPKKLLDALERKEIKPYLDINRQKKPGTYLLPVECFLSNGPLEVQSIKPAEMKVEIL